MKRFLNLRTVARCAVLVGMIALFYWLLPVATTSRLSADHVRWGMGASDLSPTVASSLSSFWAFALLALGALAEIFGGLKAQITFATAAGLSAWLSVLAVAILSFNVRLPALALAVLAPTFLWTSVVPNGTSLVFLLLALMSYFSRPSVTYLDAPKRWTIGAVIDGLACSLSPAAWILVLLRAVHARDGAHGDSSERRRLVSLRLILFVVGFSFHFVLGVILNETTASTVPSFAAIPAMELLKSLRRDDVLAAGVIFLGGGGEVVMGLLAALNIAIAITVSREWQTRVALKSLSIRATTSARWALLIAPFFVLVTAGQPTAWRFAHPGANTVVEDFARNIVQSLPKPTVVFVNSATEEAAIRYAREIYSRGKDIAVLRPLNVFDGSTQARVAAIVPKFSLSEAMAATSQITAASFFDSVVVPNLNRGVPLWLESAPEISGSREQGLEINFLGNGFLFSGLQGSTRFLASREALRGAFVRYRPTAREFSPRRSVEIKIFERYAAFHLGMAKIIEFEKKTSDWKLRARGEYYAALKKVEWYPGLFAKVCGDTDKDPLDVCVETAWFHRRPETRPETRPEAR